MAISNYPAYFKGTGNDLDFFSSLLLLHFARLLFLFILLCPLYVTVSHSLICSASHSHCSLCVSCVCALCDDLIEKHSTIMLYNDVEGKQAKLPFRQRLVIQKLFAVIWQDGVIEPHISFFSFASVPCGPMPLTYSRYNLAPRTTGKSFASFLFFSCSSRFYAFGRFIRFFFVCVYASWRWFFMRVYVSRKIDNF